MNQWVMKTFALAEINFVNMSTAVYLLQAVNMSYFIKEIVIGVVVRTVAWEEIGQLYFQKSINIEFNFVLVGQ